jgi:glycerophosphoryl diester phosphodiesterase
MTNSFLLIAHRGASGYRLENTLVAMQHALELGADAVELDVWAIEGTLVVFHDRRLERLTNGTGVLTHYPLATLRELTVRGSERIPTLDEVLDLLAGRCLVNIEIKGAGCEEVLATTLDHRTQNGWREEQFLVSSFNHVALHTLHHHAPTIPIGVLVEGRLIDPVARAHEVGAIAVNFSNDFLVDEDIETAHGAGLAVYVYTVNERDEIEALARRGVDGVFCNYPDRRPVHAPARTRWRH